MKRNLIALAVAAALVAPIAANAAPKVYGKLNLSVEAYKKEVDTISTLSPLARTSAEEKYSRLQSNASRFGMKGEDELTADLSAVYQIEFGVDADQGLDTVDTAVDAKAKTTNIEKIVQRNRYVGIKSQKFGTVKLGKYDTYTKLAQGEIDLFNDFLGDMQYVITGENRINNVVGYESPKLFDALTINVMAQTQDAAKDPKNGQSASVVYSNEELGMYYALAVDNNIKSTSALDTSSTTRDNVRLVGSYKIADLTLNAIYQTSQLAVSPAVLGATADKETDWQLGASYKIADELLKVQFGEAKADNEKTAVQKHTQWSIGADHNFTSKTKAFVWYTEQKEEQLTTALTNADTKINSLAVGVEHKF